MCTDLIILIQRPQIPRLDQPSHFFIRESDPVVEIAEPEDGIVVFDGAIALEA